MVKTAEKHLKPLQLGDVPDTFADVDALVEDLDYRPSTPVEVGISRFVDWYRDYYRSEIMSQREEYPLSGWAMSGCPLPLLLASRGASSVSTSHPRASQELRNGHDRTGEVDAAEFDTTDVHFQR